MKYDVKSIPGVNFSPPSVQEIFDGINQDLVPQPDDEEKTDLNKKYFDKQNQEQEGK